MSLLDGYAFEDCLVVDFRVSPQLDEVTITCEAFFPLQSAEKIRRKGLLLISCKKLLRLNAEINQELTRDLERPYSPEGDDFRSNEIIDLHAAAGQEKHTSLTLCSDMLNLDIECLEFSSKRIEE
jgi:hypothetical protein